MQNQIQSSLTINFTIMQDLRNRVHLIGNLGMDPEVKQLSNDNKLAKFSLATNQSYTNGNGEKVEDTQWHNIVVWGKLAELCGNLLKKGHEIAMDGRIVYRNYDDKEGQKKYITEIVMNEFILMSKKQN